MAIQEASLAGNVEFLVTTAARAPSVHNTQPWRFRVGPSAVELSYDPRRKLRTDPLGREMIISCGAAVFGLRLAVRSLGWLPAVELLPDRARPRLMARVGLGQAAPVTRAERRMLEAVPHRHTHRGPFEPGPLPPGLLAGLQHDARAEGAELVLVEDELGYRRLADITAAAARRLDLDPLARAEVRRWTRNAGSQARDGVPAVAFAARDGVSGGAFAARGGPRPGRRLAQRDWDLDRGLARLPEGGPSPCATAVLVTRGDRRLDWLRAGQALHRMLLHATTAWVFASLYTQPLEAAASRALIRDRLALPGNPQVLMQFGPARSTHPTARRDAGEITDSH